MAQDGGGGNGGVAADSSSAANGHRIPGNGKASVRPSAAVPAHIVGTADHYAKFVQLCRARIAELGLTFETVDELCSFPERYTSILLSGGKSMSVYSFFVMARALALLPQFAHDPAQHELLKAREEWIETRRKGPRWRSNRRSRNGTSKHKSYPDFLHNRALAGGLMRARNLSPRKRRAIAQKAALARWHPNNGHGGGTL
jgi:hypothetical protein